MAINLSVAAQEIIDIFGIQPTHFNCRCNINDDFSWRVAKMETELNTEDVEYEDVTHLRLEK